jgi:hypothetical protein
MSFSAFTGDVNRWAASANGEAFFAGGTGAAGPATTGDETGSSVSDSAATASGNEKRLAASEVGGDTSGEERHAAGAAGLSATARGENRATAAAAAATSGSNMEGTDGCFEGAGLAAGSSGTNEVLLSGRRAAML